MTLPTLPASDNPWSPSVRNAFQRINAVYSTASAYLEAASFYPHRLEGYLNAIATDVFPVLLLLEESADQEGIPQTWLSDVSNKFVEIYSLLAESLESANQV